MKLSKLFLLLFITLLAACGTTRTVRTAGLDAMNKGADNMHKATSIAAGKATMAKDAMASRASGVRRSEVAYDANNPFPPARPGECFAKIVTQPQYETVKEKVLVKEASTRIKTLPGKYDTIKERVVAKEASTRLEVIPATYKWVEEEVLVEPARTTLRTVPAKYKTLTERVVDKPATTKWKKGTGPLGSQTSVNSAGEVMCLVDVPCLLYTSPSPRDKRQSRMPSSA